MSNLQSPNYSVTPDVTRGLSTLQLTPLLSHPDERIVNEVLALMEVLLESGNRTVQRGFVQLKSSPDSSLFPTLQTLLRRATVLYEER